LTHRDNQRLTDSGAHDLRTDFLSYLSLPFASIEVTTRVTARYEQTSAWLPCAAEASSVHQHQINRTVLRRVHDVCSHNLHFARYDAPPIHRSRDTCKKERPCSWERTNASML